MFSIGMDSILKRPATTEDEMKELSKWNIGNVKDCREEEAGRETLLPIVRLSTGRKKNSQAFWNWKQSQEV